MKGKLFFVLLTAAAVGVLFVLSYRENGVKTYPSYKTSSMRGFHLTHKVNDIIKWELEAEKTTFPEGEREVVLEDLTMKINYEREFIVKGGNGIYDINKQDLVVNRPVEIDMEGAKLTTDSLTWDGKKGIITTRDDIKIEGENFLIEGSGFTAKIKDRQIRVLGNVKGIFYR